MRQAAVSTVPVASLVSTLHAQGISFRRRGEHLAVQGGKSLPPDVLQAVRRHKAELLALCDRAAPHDSLLHDSIDLIDEKPTISVAKSDGTPRMALELPSGGVLWHSDVLGEVIRLVPDGAPLPTDTGGPVVYTASEVRALKGISPAGLRWLHEVKKVWGGDVLPE